MISENSLLRATLFISLLIIMFLLEGYKPARIWTELRKNRLFFSLKLALVNNLVMKFVVATPFLAWAALVDQKGWGLAPALGIQGWTLILATIVLFDFLDAIKHLMFHRVPFMWRLHRAHHTDTHLDILTALRYHPGEFIVSAAFKAVWIAAWGPSMTAFIVFEITLNMASQFHHSNIDLPDFIEKPLQKILVTPRYHAIHHTIHRERGDQNFSTIFSFWDYILGTHQKAKKEDINLKKLHDEKNNHLSLKVLISDPLKKENL